MIPIVNNAELDKELKRVHRDLNVLYEISNAMRSTLELNNILYIILTGVTSHFGLGFNRAILFLVNEKDQCLEPKMAIGPDSGEEAKKIWEYIDKTNQHLDDLIKGDKISQNTNHASFYESIKKIKIPISKNDQNLLSDVFHNGTQLHITEEKIHEFENDILLTNFKTKELVIIPLRAKDKEIGVIVADNLFTQKKVTDDDLKMFTMLANQAGLAIENSRLYEIVKHKSRTDAITDLSNHGFFQEQLAQEIERSRSLKTMLSLIIMDIDNFKHLNDTHGHQNGDLVLKEIGHLLKKSSREFDTTCRYGGEEFSIILPQTNKEQGFLIAERLRQEIEAYSFSRVNTKEPLKITVSVGLATYPLDAQTKEELITQADKAMYIAKFGGKNQTILAQN